MRTLRKTLVLLATTGAAVALGTLPADAAVTQLNVTSVTLTGPNTATATGTITCSPTAPPGGQRVTVIVKQPGAVQAVGSSGLFQCTGSPQTYTAALSQVGLTAGPATYTASSSGTAGSLVATGTVTVS